MALNHSLAEGRDQIMRFTSCSGRRKMASKPDAKEMNTATNSSSVNQDARPRWLRVVLWGVAAWLIFWFAFILFAITCALLFQFVLKSPGISGVPGFLVLLVILLLSIALAIIGARWQNRFLALKSMRANYAALVVMLTIAVLFMPVPFTYAFFE